MWLFKDYGHFLLINWTLLIFLERCQFFYRLRDLIIRQAINLLGVNPWNSPWHYSSSIESVLSSIRHFHANCRKFPIIDLWQAIRTWGMWRWNAGYLSSPLSTCHSSGTSRSSTLLNATIEETFRWIFRYMGLRKLRRLANRDRPLMQRILQVYTGD